jgi:chromosome segregation ATPase
MEILMSIFLSIFIGIALMELYAWLDPLAKWLVNRVAKDLPKDRQADFTEQFMADLATLPNSVAKVYFALRDCTLAAHNIHEAVRRETILSAADNFDSFYSKINQLDQVIEKSSAQVRTCLRQSIEFITAVDHSMEALRRNRRHDDVDAETAIHHCQALSSPVVDRISTIRASVDQRLASIDGLLDRLREPIARASKTNENIRRRMLDDDPLDDNAVELSSSLTETFKEMTAILDEYNADKSSSDFSDIPAFPENFGTKAKEIAEAIATAARLLKRPT